MIVITGAAGFIASNLAGSLNSMGYEKLVLVDDFSNPLKNKNLQHKLFSEKVDRKSFFDWFELNHAKVTFVFHLGARTDTSEFDITIFNKLNLHFSKRIWQFCSKYSIPLVYASSAATYGMGEYGFIDDHNSIQKLTPLNPYGESKNNFDFWLLNQKNSPPFWAGYKFFNVYGPNEYHKNRMASVVFHAFRQIKNNGQMQLFKSHHPEYADGHQKRDFIYVKDLIDVLIYSMKMSFNNGIYNLGSGTARTFLDLSIATFSSLGLEPNISFIDTPIDIREKYQYYTKADLTKLKSTGYNKSFTSLEKGVNDYVTNYLLNNKYA